MNTFNRGRQSSLRLAFLASLCLAFVAVSAAQQPPSEYTRIEKRIDSLALEIRQQPKDVALRVDLAEAQIRIGRFPAAEATLKEALRIKPRHVPALVAFGNLYRKRYQFPEAIKTSERIRMLAPQDAPGRLLAANLAEDRMDFAAARTLYQDMLRKNPDEISALYGLAHLEYWENRLDAAEKQLANVTAKAPAHAKAWLLQAQIHRSRQENAQYAVCVRKAVESDPLDDAARASLGNLLMREEKKPAEGHAENRFALQINPYSSPAHGAMGNGWTARTYPEMKIELEGKKRQDLLEATKSGDGMLTLRNFGKADQAFDAALKLKADYIPALIGKGIVQYQRGKYDKALPWFFDALKVDPDYGLAHYGVSLCLLRKKDRMNVRFAEIERGFAAKDVPEPAALQDVFTGYASFDPDLKKIIRLSVQPLRAYLPLLKEKRVMFHLFPMQQFLWQVPGHARMKGTRTFDGRLWDDVKGDGGSNASSGAEWERDVKYLRFNVLTHEFAHQVHGFLPKDLKDEIHRLYLAAMKAGKPLDFYAAANEMEYFAQGVEAFVSEDKLADQKITSGHTRKELLQRDPDLYALIEKMNAQK
jgi:tetratricopeptide (TPR) repeat protein